MTPSVPATPTVEATSSPDDLGPDVIAEVVTTDLVMRTAPGVGPTSLMYPGRLTVGDVVYVVDGPQLADGYEWFLVDPYKLLESADGPGRELRFGWVAAADKNGEEWIAPMRPSCPETAALETLNELDSPERILCFGGESLMLEGEVLCQDLGPPVPYPSPAWLTWDGCLLFPLGGSQRDGEAFRGISVHYPPGAERAEGHLRVIGHIDDPAAAGCAFDVPVQDGDLHSLELSHREQQLRCRTAFVVDSATVVTDSP